jgi:hypothetical protein
MWTSLSETRIPASEKPVHVAAIPLSIVEKDHPLSALLQGSRAKFIDYPGLRPGLSERGLSGLKAAVGVDARYCGIAGLFFGASIYTRD